MYLQENPDFILLLRLINLGLNAWSMMDTATFKETKVATQTGRQTDR